MTYTIEIYLYENQLIFTGIRDLYFEKYKGVGPGIYSQPILCLPNSCSASEIQQAFKIVPLIYGKNFFTPVILGVIKRSPKQKSLEITFVDSPHMKVVKIILFTLLLGTIFAFSGSKDIICVFPFSLSLVILIFFLLFNHHAKNDAALTISKSISLMM